MSGNSRKRKFEAGSEGRTQGHHKDEKRARNKKRFAKGGQHSLPIGSRGFLISCTTGKEREAGREALQILSTSYEDAHSAEQPAVHKQGDEDTKSIESLLKSEITALHEGQEEIVVYHKTGISGLLYVAIAAGHADVDPAAILLRIAEEVRQKRQCNSRHLMRFSPIDVVCHATIDDMQKSARKVVLPHFPASDEAAPKTFAVYYDHRASAKFERDLVIDAVINGIKQPPHKANLSNPDLAIVVQLMKNVCAIGVAPKYREFAKYNFRELSTVEKNDQKD